MITLTLLHPIKNTPVQSWSFEHEPVIRMGRATDNHVVLYSAVVSRRHVELHRNNAGWEIVNLGANGTFIDGERVNKLQASDGLIIRLARSGPSIQVGLEQTAAIGSGSPSIEPLYPASPPEAIYEPALSPEPPPPVYSETNGHGTVYDASLNPDPIPEIGDSRQTIINEDEFESPHYLDPSAGQPSADLSFIPDELSYSPPPQFTPPAPDFSPDYGNVSPELPDVGFANVPFSFTPIENFADNAALNSNFPGAVPSGIDTPPLPFTGSPVNFQESPTALTDEQHADLRSQPDSQPFSLAGLQTPGSQPDPNRPFYPEASPFENHLTTETPAPPASPTAANVISFSLETGQPLQVQQSIGRYQVVKTIVHSNHNITYLAWRDGRSMALKTLNANWSDYSHASAALEEEARVFHKLRHPGLPKLIDFFWVDGQPVLAREMVYGKNLEQYVANNGPIPINQALGWMIQVCDILSYLHQQAPALLHYDVKPRNLIRRATSQGSWEISLVGLQLSSTLTEVGTQMGFPAYTAPEQQEGRAVPSSDLYSLGPTLVYLLTGQEPELFYRYVNNEYRLVAEEVPGLSHQVAQLIHTLTELKVEFRYASAKDVSRSIQQILNSQSSVGTRL